MRLTSFASSIRKNNARARGWSGMRFWCDGLSPIDLVVVGLVSARVEPKLPNFSCSCSIDSKWSSDQALQAVADAHHSWHGYLADVACLETQPHLSRLPRLPGCPAANVNWESSRSDLITKS